MEASKVAPAKLKHQYTGNQFVESNSDSATEALKAESQKSEVPNVICQFPIRDGWIGVIVCTHPDMSETQLKRFLQQSNVQSDQELGRFEIAHQCYVIFETKVHSMDEDNTEKCPLSISDLLTAREIQVANLVAQGYSNKQVAKRLRLSVWTVSTHLRRIFMKLGVDSRAAMVYKCASIL